MMRYFFVPEADLTVAMQNRAFVSNYLVTLQDNVEYYVLEAPLAEMKRVTIFDNYYWYTKEEMIAIIGPVLGQE